MGSDPIIGVDVRSITLRWEAEMGSDPISVSMMINFSDGPPRHELPRPLVGIIDDDLRHHLDGADLEGQRHHPRHEVRDGHRGRRGDRTPAQPLQHASQMGLAYLYPRFTPAQPSF